MLVHSSTCRLHSWLAPWAQAWSPELSNAPAEPAKAFELVEGHELAGGRLDNRRWEGGRMLRVWTPPGVHALPCSQRAWSWASRRGSLLERLAAMKMPALPQVQLRQVTGVPDSPLFLTPTPVKVQTATGLQATSTVAPRPEATQCCT